MKKYPNIYITLDENAQYYECGFSCDNALVLRVQDERYFITDSRYVLEAKECVSNNTQVIDSSDFVSTLQKLLKALNIKKVVFNPQELSLYFYQSICKKIGEGCVLDPQVNFHQYLRIKKTQEEVSFIAKSQKLNKKAFKCFAQQYICKALKKHPSEQELHYRATQYLSDFGKYSLSFDPIVGINANGAKPHALPNKHCLLKKHDILLFDAGIKYERYCSDMTRTASISGEVNFGKRQKFKRAFVQKIYDIVYKAQEETINKARSGMSGKQIDAIAREIIHKSDYGEYFVHSTGHGVGLDIHELPRISRFSEDIIEDDMVFSIEPGIYLPNDFGVRIEDIVVMKNGRAQVL